MSILDKVSPGPYHHKVDGFKITIGNASTRHDYLEHDYTVATISGNSIQDECNGALLAGSFELARAAEAVVDCWESGDLAAAVRELDNVLRQIEAEA